MYKCLLFVAALAISSCTSISCYYAATDAVELPVGTQLETKIPLVGMLDESIDDPSIHYLNITALPGYSNRFVKKRVGIPVGTRLKVVGARKARSPLCMAQDPEVVLQAEIPLEPTNAEIHMKLPAAQAHLSETTLGS